MSVHSRATSVQRVTSLQELYAVRSDWLGLEAACGLQLPFQTWEWTVAWWSHLRADSAGVRDSLRIYVVRDDAGRVMGIAPMILTERPARGPVRLRYLQFIGADPNITEIRSVVCEPAVEAECYRALREYLATVPLEWDWIAWEYPGELRAVPPTELSRRSDKSAFVLELGPSWEAMKHGLKRNIKESLRRCYNSLHRDGLTATLEIVELPAAVEAALPEFFRLHTQRARLNGVPNHPDVFTSSESRQFLSDVCRRLSERGVAKVFRLWVDEKVVATRIGFLMGQTLYLYYSGWDAQFARYSVMTTLLAETIQYAIKSGLTAVHLSTGRDVAKTRWGPREVTYATGVELSPRQSARALFVAFHLAKRLGTAKVARALAPAFLVRGSQTSVPRLSRSPGPGLLKFHGLAASAAVLLVLDLFDGTLDGTARFAAPLVG